MHHLSLSPNPLHLLNIRGACSSSNRRQAATAKHAAAAGAVATPVNRSSSYEATSSLQLKKEVMLPAAAATN